MEIKAASEPANRNIIRALMISLQATSQSPPHLPVMAMAMAAAVMVVEAMLVVVLQYCIMTPGNLI